MRPMRPKRPALTLFAAPTALVALIAFASPARADVAPPSLLLSRFETDVPGNTISRDAGWSAPIPGGGGDSLWLFGDSGWTGGFWFGTTAARGPATRGQVPTRLSELLTPPTASSVPSNRGPSGFLPGSPEGMLDQDGHACEDTTDEFPTLAASWPAGAVTIPNTTRMLVASADVCVAEQLLHERFVLTEYTPSNNTLGNRARVFTNTAGLPVQQQLVSPVVSNGFVYFVSSVCDGTDFGVCTAGRVFLARVQANATSWRTAASYRWWDGSTWNSSYAAAASILPAARPSSTISLADYSAVGKGFAIVESNSIWGDFTVWRSSSLTSGWTATRTGVTPCQDGPGTALDFCRAQIGHPELSTTSDLLLSWYNPADAHIGVMAVPW